MGQVWGSSWSNQVCWESQASLLDADSFCLAKQMVNDHHINLSFFLVGFSCVWTNMAWRVTQNIPAIGNFQLSVCLAVLGSASVSLSHHLYAMPPYPFLSVDYPASLCLFCHHMWIGASFLLGSGAHSSIYVVGAPTYTRGYFALASRRISMGFWSQRGLQLGHLVYVSVFIGIHGYGLFVRSDTI
jgi:hypothetical protein